MLPAGRTAKNVLSWLESSVEKAANAAEEHEALRAEIRALKATLEDTFRLASVKVQLPFFFISKWNHLTCIQHLVVCSRHSK